MDHAQEDGAAAPRSTLETTPAQQDALIRTARRHPATIALIHEITAQVNARADKRIAQAKAELREDLRVKTPSVAGVAMNPFVAFATVNLLLVTVALGLGQVMSPWLAGLIVTAFTFVGSAALVIRASHKRSDRLPFLRKLLARRFAERLQASV